MWRVSFICDTCHSFVTWLIGTQHIHTLYVTHVIRLWHTLTSSICCMCHVSFIRDMSEGAGLFWYETPLIHTWHCHLIHSCVYHDSSLYLQVHPCCTATYCSALQHTATHYTTLQHPATTCKPLYRTTTLCNTLQHPSTHCNTLQHAAIHRNTALHTATHCVHHGSSIHFQAHPWQIDKWDILSSHAWHKLTHTSDALTCMTSLTYIPHSWLNALSLSNLHPRTPLSLCLCACVSVFFESESIFYIWMYAYTYVNMYVYIYTYIYNT